MTLSVLYRVAIKKLKEAGIEPAELDARLLICHGMNITTEKFYLIQSDALSPGQIKKIKLIIKKRAQNMPVAYTLGHKEFFGLDFLVDKNTLIPRPETEKLVELVLARSKYKEVSIMDIGTGSGNIIISLAKNINGDFFASDISPAVLTVAKKNAAIHKVNKKIKFIKSDLFSNINNLKFDIIVANLPYVPKNNLTIQQLSHEPFDAIFAEDNGTDIIKRFLKSAPKYLSDNNSMILLELDPRNALDIKNFAQKYFPKTKIRLEKDLAGFWRYLIIKN